MFATTYAERLTVWQAAVNASQAHVKLGKSLQQRGMTLLNSVTMTSDNRRVDLSQVDEGNLSKIMASANSSIAKGTKIEQDAHHNLIKLYKTKPKEAP